MIFLNLDNALGKGGCLLLFVIKLFMFCHALSSHKVIKSYDSKSRVFFFDMSSCWFQWLRGLQLEPVAWRTCGCFVSCLSITRTWHSIILLLANECWSLSCFGRYECTKHLCISFGRHSHPSIFTPTSMVSSVCQAVGRCQTISAEHLEGLEDKFVFFLFGVYWVYWYVWGGVRVHMHPPSPECNHLLVWLVGKVEDYIDWDVLLTSRFAVWFHTTIPFEVDVWSKTTKNHWSWWGCCIYIYIRSMGMLHLKYQKVFKITVGDHIVLINGKRCFATYCIYILNQEAAVRYYLIVFGWNSHLQHSSIQIIALQRPPKVYGGWPQKWSFNKGENIIFRVHGISILDSPTRSVSRDWFKLGIGLLCGSPFLSGRTGWGRWVQPWGGDKSDDFCDLKLQMRGGHQWVLSNIIGSHIFGFTCKNARFLRLVNTAQ